MFFFQILFLFFFSLTVDGLRAQSLLIRITGSATLFPFAAKVAERFAGKYPGISTPLVEAVGTGAGVSLFCAGVGNRTPSILMASRQLTPAEEELCLRNGVEFWEFKVGLDGIVLVQSHDSRTLHLSKEEVFRALTALNPHPPYYWSALGKGLPSTPIQILGPSPASGTRDALIELLLKPFCEFCVEPKQARLCRRLRRDEAYSDVGDNQNVVIQKVLLNPVSVGVLSFSFFKQNRHALRAIPIDGVVPSRQTLLSGKYPVARPLYLYIKRAHWSEQLKGYLREFLSETAIGETGYLTEDGLVTLPFMSRQRQRQRLEHL